jgi:hypothetical protein
MGLSRRGIYIQTAMRDRDREMREEKAMKGGEAAHRIKILKKTTRFYCSKLVPPLFLPIS